MSESQPQPTASPRWGLATKLVAGFTIVALAAAFLVKFQNILGPLILVFILAYLLHPVASFLHQKLHLRWNLSVGLVYVVLLLILLGLLTAGGVGLIQQIQSLITLLNDSLTELPRLFDQLSHQAYQIGPFALDLTQVEMESFNQQLLSMAQTFLSRTGSLFGTLASGAAQTFGWAAFTLLASYFVLAETGGLRERIIQVRLPGYSEDLRKLGDHLGRIWNAFLRGQFILVGLAVLVYTIVLSTLGVRYALGLALLAGLARFVPYVGPAVNWIVLALVTYFQTFKLFGMSPLVYTLVVLGIAVLIDQIFDNLVSPRIMSQTLKVHPVGVMVAAIVAASLIGFIGVVIAAPILATFALLGRYTFRKMFDLDPWPAEEATPAPAETSIWFRLMERLRGLWKHIRSLPLPPKNNRKGEEK